MSRVLPPTPARPLQCTPETNKSQEIGDALCASATKGGDALLSALGAGGEAAQAAMKALLTGNCPNEDAKQEAVSAFGATDAMNSASSVMA